MLQWQQPSLTHSAYHVLGTLLCLPAALGDKCYHYLHSTGDETVVEQGQLVCPRTHGQKVVGPGGRQPCHRQQALPTDQVSDHATWGALAGQSVNIRISLSLGHSRLALWIVVFVACATIFYYFILLLFHFVPHHLHLWALVCLGPCQAPTAQYLGGAHGPGA